MFEIPQQCREVASAGVDATFRRFTGPKYSESRARTPGIAGALVWGVGSRRRRVLPGDIVAVERRTTRRHFLLKPCESGRVKNLLWYALAVMAKKHGVEIVAVVVMSTHIHIILIDHAARRPHFYRDFFRIFALGIKAIHGWPEEVFNKSRPTEHKLLNNDAIIESASYLIGNPPASGAVRYAREWPGAKTRPTDLGQRVIVAKRPSDFFEALARPSRKKKKSADKAKGRRRKRSSVNRRYNRKLWPDEAELRLGVPKSILDDMTLQVFQQKVGDQVRDIEAKAHAFAKENGVKFQGAQRAMRCKHTRRANSYEEWGSLNPRFSAAGNSDDAQKEIEAFRKFDRDYDAALARWQQGHRKVVFPAGTWWMRVHHGVRCHPPP